MASVKDIAWVAGLLEGEGCFCLGSNGHNPRISLAMTDADTVIHAAEILGAHKVIENNQVTKAGKPIYRMMLYGRRAIAWMMTIYGLMGERRKQKIKECLEQWMAKPRKSYPERKPYSRGGKIVWMGAGGYSH